MYVPLKQPHFHLQTTPHPAVGGIQVVMTLVCTQLMDRAGRRPLLLTSTVGMAFCTALLSVYFTHKRAITSCALLPPASLACSSPADPETVGPPFQIQPRAGHRHLAWRLGRRHRVLQPGAGRHPVAAGVRGAFTPLAEREDERRERSEAAHRPQRLLAVGPRAGC